MTATFAPGASGAVDVERPADQGGSIRPLSDGGPFAALLGNTGLPLVLVGLMGAIAFGAWHALLPGHGKTLMAAAMVGSTARVRQAVTAGVAVALMHTVSVIGLGVLVLALERTFRPETLYPWLGAASGLAALAVGAYLLRGRIRTWRHGHTHPLAPAHDHVRSEGHPHADDDEQGHAHVLPPEGFLSRRGIAALAFAGGILPAPSALLVMLAAIQSQRAAYGLGLVLAFSVGLAAALVLVGLGTMRARDVMVGRLSATAGRLIPVLSAAAIVAVGLFITVRSAASF
jgi:ABC-type nickel/cobalt efflux system permease component RcnA